MTDKFKQFKTIPPVFDAFNRESPVQSALGSRRVKEVQEVTELRSTNYDGASSPSIPYRLTRRGIDIQGLASFLSDALIIDELVSGSGTSFTLAYTPVAGTIALYGNGLRLKNGTDFSNSGTTITILIGTYDSGTVIADYYKV